METPRFALISHVLPPSPSGQAVVLYRLLRDLDPADYCVASVGDYQNEAFAAVTARLHCRYHKIADGGGFRVTPLLREMRRRVRRQPRSNGGTAQNPEPTPANRGLLAGLGALLANAENRWYLPRQIARRAADIERIAGQEWCDMLVACSGDLVDLAAVRQAALRTGLPYVAYMFDDISQHAPLASRILGDAAGVIVPNAFLAEAYRSRYGIEAAVVPNPIESIPDNDWRPIGEPIRIVYTGAIYDAHFDAVGRLIGAIANQRKPAVQLDLYTPMSADYLARHGIGLPAIIHGAVGVRDAARLQQSADIVFLPLAFDSAIPEIINTSAPGKMGELLACGRPVLVHAPKESFVSWYFRTNRCGVVVDERNPALLGQAIEWMRNEPDECRQMVQRARERAQADFSLANARARFVDVLHQIAITKMRKAS